VLRLFGFNVLSEGRDEGAKGRKREREDGQGESMIESGRGGGRRGESAEGMRI
jgi:hypothetical protein